MKSLDNQFEYWDRVSSSKTFTHPLDIKRFNVFVDKQAKILDFGCGYGRICNELYHQGFRNVIGIDLSGKMIERGSQTYPHLEMKVLKGNRLPYNPETFDAVILLAVLTCVPTNNGQKSIIQEISRVLRPEGIIYITDYWLQNDERNLNRYNQFKNKYGIYGIFELEEGAIVRHHANAWIISLLSSFKTLDLFDLNLTSMNGHILKGFQYIGQKRII